MELLISRLLSFGVILSSGIVIIGTTMFLSHQGMTLTDFGNFHGQTSSLKTLPAILRQAIEQKPEAVIQLGLLVLLATPIMRVGLSIILFWRKKDYLYVGITSLVLAVIVLALTREH